MGKSEAAAGLLNTARTYATAARHLREFAQSSGYAVDVDTTTPAFGDKFTAYLVGTVRLTDNTISKVLSRETIHEVGWRARTT